MKGGKKWTKTKFPGVRYHTDPTRKHGVGYDKYFVLNHRVGSKVFNEPVGWASEGWTAEKAGLLMAELKQNKRDGSGPLTLKEKREQKEAKQKAEEAAQRAREAANVTLADYWANVYYPAAQLSKEPASAAVEERHFRRWIAPVMGDMPVKDIDRPQWDELKTNLSNAGMTPRTKEYTTGTLRRILKHAYARRMVDNPPPTGKDVGVKGPGNGNRRLRVISHEEEALIMQELSTWDENGWRITRFAFLTGCRASEAFNLTWANVDHNQGRITFPVTKNKDTRAIPMTYPLRELFHGMMPGLPGQLVFTKADGTKYTQAPWSFQTIVERLGLNEGRGKRDRIVFHSIRHTVATRLAQRLGPRDLMDVMGWRTVEMAMRYVHGNDEAKTKALEMLGTTPQQGKILPFNHAKAN